MSFNHLEDRLFRAIDDAHSALNSLGGVQVEYMTTEEFTDALHLLQVMAVAIHGVADTATGRQPLSRELERALREIDDAWKGRCRNPRPGPSLPP